ncbi:type II toxin-antitoxin system VapC family toxin [Leptolyngbya sp. NIES-2104]|uniref:type II toxin-antitoxin system VapC family toxin n=1 Tax=Leptolyngbya sp. NIES-2104 TaxID=1552121 RepID=UPI0006EC9023|nr:PIN domain-containing protein [Leptolyngbya sp. NIES-2104]GAP94666.1 PilT protein, N-terminal [Leptolyngbya sp. NIES-2104]
MPQYLLDTNILLRLSDPNAVLNALVLDTVDRLVLQGDSCVITAQVLVEFWVVATRPVSVNGLGWTTEQTRIRIQQLLTQFALLPETEAIFTTWLDLVTTHQVMGKRTHDLRLIAVMLVYNITHLLTLNPRDFPNNIGITIVQPQDLLIP